MTSVVACDVSQFNAAVTDEYPHRWLTFRACDGSYLDKKAGRNLAWCVRARAAGKLDGFSVYVVYEPGQNDAILGILHQLDVPTDCVIMVDVESWGGKIRGDHSGEINALVDALAKRQGGDQTRVWGYANRSDFAAIWPRRPKWLGLVVASYGGSRPASPGPGALVGWQYTDGQYTIPGLPNSSKPFGRCDHNQLYIQEDDMTPDECRAVVREELHAVLTGDDGKPHQLRTIIDQELQPKIDAAVNKIVATLGLITHDGDRKHPMALVHIEAAVRAIAAKVGATVKS